MIDTTLQVLLRTTLIIIRHQQMGINQQTGKTN